MIDLHSHILPGLDDGARSLQDSREIALRAAAEGVTAIAATPHVRADYPTRASQMEFGVAEVRRHLAAERIAVEVLHGAEIDLAMLWEIPPEDLARLSIGQSRKYVLVEFPYRGWPQSLPAGLTHLRRLGMTAMLAHPERNPEVQDRPDRLEAVVRDGALVQITTASLDGRLGQAASTAAEHLLELGLAHVLASDVHGPHVRDGGFEDALGHIRSDALRRYLTVDAPAAIVAGEPLPPPPSA